MNTDLPISADLLRRYDKPGPRYTSYPTAPHFGPGFGVMFLYGTHGWIHLSVGRPDRW